MTTARIGDRELGHQSLQGVRADSRMARLSAAIASPIGVLTLLPILVACVGLSLTLLGQRSLRESNLSMARARLDESTSLMARSIGNALEQADPIMDHLAPLALEHDTIRPYDGVAHSLSDLIQGHAGVSYISISFPDGTFQGVYRDQDGTIRFQDSRVTPSGTKVKRYELRGHRQLVPYLEETSDYDPRKRDFYTLALSQPHRTWTEPYPFYRTHYTGITRTEAVREPGSGALHAVITVDFDVNALSGVLRRISLAGATTLLYQNNGVVLAYPRGEVMIANMPLHRDRALLYSDLNDPLLNAFFAERAATPRPTPNHPARLTVQAAPFLVAEKPVLAGGDLPWSVATLVPERVILNALHEHQIKSSVAAAIATVIASGMAWLFAWHILRTRREVAQAREEARAASARVQELGSYRLVEMLGKGGMGEVWRAEHRLLVRQAAIKLISLSEGVGIASSEVQERFRREAQSLATLRCRNTIELFDYGITENGTCFYVMELLDGMDLETLVDRFGPQPAARVISFLVQVCNSLAEAHDAGLVHRDIKPANVYVCRVADEVDVIKVLDFGLVRAVHDAAPAHPSLEASSATAHADTAHVATSHADTSHADTSHADTSHADTAHADTAHADTSHADTSHADTAHADTAHADTSHADTTRPDVARARVARADNARADNARADIARPDAPRVDTSATESGVREGAREARITQVGQAMGTPAYMAPEQALGHELDGRADLYALGCIGFYLLSGRLLFQRNGSLATMMAHITDPLPDFTHCIRGYLPLELATLLRECLAKKPADRPHDARSLAAALKAISIPPSEQWDEHKAQTWWANSATQRPRRRPEPALPTQVVA